MFFHKIRDISWSRRRLAGRIRTIDKDMAPGTRFDRFLLIAPDNAGLCLLAGRALLGDGRDTEGFRLLVRACLADPAVRGRFLRTVEQLARDKRFFADPVCSLAAFHVDMHFHPTDDGRKTMVVTELAFRRYLAPALEAGFEAAWRQDAIGAALAAGRFEAGAGALLRHLQRMLDPLLPEGAMFSTGWMRTGMLNIGIMRFVGRAYATGRLTAPLTGRQVVTAPIVDPAAGTPPRGMSVTEALPADRHCWIGPLIDTPAGDVRSFHGLPETGTDHASNRSTDGSRSRVLALRIRGGSLDSFYVLRGAGGEVVSGAFAVDPVEAVPFTVLPASDGRAYPDSVRAVSGGTAFLRRHARRVAVDGVAVPFALHRNVDVYGHFVLDYLARLTMLDRRIGADMTILAHRPPRPHERELLEILGIGAPVRVMDADADYACDELVTCSAGVRYPVNFPLLAAFRAEICDRLPNTATRRDRRLYVSRRRQARRALENEAELEAALQAIGFEVLHPEEHDVRRQVEAFHGAAIVVSPFGSQLHANMLLAGGVPSVVEIFTGPHPRNTLALHAFLGQDVRACRARWVGGQRFRADVAAVVAMAKGLLATGPGG